MSIYPILVEADKASMQTLFQESINAFSKITPLEIPAFLLPFVVAVVVDLMTHK